MATYVLVHGSNQGGWIWQPVANLLRAAGHQVYAPSLDGCGERKSQMRPGITAETQADEVAQLMFCGGRPAMVVPTANTLSPPYEGR
jgi:pimeloyl-ACP methyl ester carboxylesterase